ncbi:putative disease resistance protein RGA4 [Silene latifolia]|uniref:putative disease resistance protein RGA4 n=1 Tax=Silene latifolia TaxID=37657 RepID=UPI003D779688
MHDVALEVAEKEICAASSFTGDIDKKVRHVSAMRGKYANYSITKAHIRTYLHFGTCISDATTVDIELILESYKSLRALDLSFLNVKTVPSSIGKLIHLRYLELSSQDFESLPKSITKLYNLHTLDLFYSSKLKQLPEDLSKLVNLRVLKMPYSDSITFMPSGMGKLTSLYKLTKFVIGKANSSLKQHVDLEGLKALKNLRESIKIVIHFPESGAFVKCDSVKEGFYMRDKEHIKGITLECKHEESNRQTDYEEELVGALQPHANLEELDLVGYRCVTMPRWAKEDNLATFLPNLVSLCLDHCSELQYLPSLGKLHHLRSLHISELPNLEYIDNHPAIALLPVSNGEGLSLLPCLEKIYFDKLPKLKTWWRRSGNETHQFSSLTLFRLKSLGILKCPELTSLPYCPNVEKLNFFDFNENFQIITNKGTSELLGKVTSSTSASPTSYPKLRKVYTDNLAWLHSSLPMDAFQSLSYLLIFNDQKLESLTEYEQVFRACSSSLHTLRFNHCPKLRCLSRGLGHLACLESLYLSRIPIVSLADEKTDVEDEDDGRPWGSLCNSLQYLEIAECNELKSIPRWLLNLTSLRHLAVSGCSVDLYERCQSSTGQDWPHIQHIPNLSITQIRQ